MSDAQHRLSADEMVAEISRLPSSVPAIASTTAAAIKRSAEQVIEDIENQRDQAKRAFMEFDAAASEAQRMIQIRAETIAQTAESFITSLAGNSLQVRKIGNDVATFGGDA